MNPGTIFILNGGSSYGKTTFGRALQELVAGPTLLMGIDLVVDTSHDSAASCAAAIKSALDGGLQPGAFADMQRKYL